MTLDMSHTIKKGSSLCYHICSDSYVHYMPFLILLLASFPSMYACMSRYCVYVRHVVDGVASASYRLGYWRYRKSYFCFTEDVIFLNEFIL